MYVIKKLTKYLLLCTIMLNSLNVLSQRITEFSGDYDIFLQELNNIFQKVSVKETKLLCEEMYTDLVFKWDNGVYTNELKENIHSVCNLILKRRLKAYPHFYFYLGSMNAMMDADQPLNSYRAWHKTVDQLVNDKRSSKPFTTFIENSFRLLKKNVLYESRATKWVSDNGNFYFDYDTVPKVIFDRLTLTCYANKDSSKIYMTQGVYMPLSQMWNGT